MMKDYRLILKRKLSAIIGVKKVMAWKITG